MSLGKFVPDDGSEVSAVISDKNAHIFMYESERCSAVSDSLRSYGL